MIDLLANLLHLANAAPPYGDWRREHFYAMKQRILERFGRRDGEDIQFITKPCWGDRRRGYRGVCTRDQECRCGGSGVYDFYWVRLERWRMGDHIFHRPVERLRSSPGKVTIEGIIRHQVPDRWQAHEAHLLLSLIFDRRLFVSMLDYICHDWPTTWDLPPLTLLNKLWIRHRFDRMVERLFPTELPS
jgi:hypothetical protein